MPKYTNEFARPGHYEHEIQGNAGGQNGSGKIGVFRLKPNRVLWKPKGQQQFFSVSLDDFVAWITNPATATTRTGS